MHRPNPSFNRDALKRAPYFIVISLVEIFSLILIIKLWSSSEHKIFKIISTLIGLIPVLGLFFLLFVFFPQPQLRNLQNRGPRGRYTDNFNAMKCILKNSDSVENVKKH